MRRHDRQVAAWPQRTQRATASTKRLASWDGQLCMQKQVSLLNCMYSMVLHHCLHLSSRKATGPQAGAARSGGTSWSGRPLQSRALAARNREILTLSFHLCQRGTAVCTVKFNINRSATRHSGALPQGRRRQRPMVLPGRRALRLLPFLWKATDCASNHSFVASFASPQDRFAGQTGKRRSRWRHAAHNHHRPGPDRHCRCAPIPGLSPRDTRLGGRRAQAACQQDITLYCAGIQPYSRRLAPGRKFQHPAAAVTAGQPVPPASFCSWMPMIQWRR